MPQDEAQEAAYRSADLRVMETGLFSDCVVTCGPKTWNLHRVTLCTRSTWFMRVLTSQFMEGCEAFLDIQEQDPDAVEVCLKYIYGGVAAIDIAQELETRRLQPIKFCGELYRSADFFMLKPLYNFVQAYLGEYFDDKIKWMYTFGNAPGDYYKEQTARVWVEDLKDAIIDAVEWSTPVIHNMLLEFVWAGRCWLARTNHVPPDTPHMHILDWLNENFPGFFTEARDLCTNPRWRAEAPTAPI